MDSNENGEYYVKVTDDKKSEDGPDLYKINSEEKRLELLAGLIDGCGRANKEENCYQLKIIVFILVNVLISVIQTAVDEANKAVSKAESIRKFRILTTDFTIAGGQLTAKLSIKRHVIAQEFAAEIEALYEKE